MKVENGSAGAWAGRSGSIGLARPTVSVVIASRDRQESLRACLESIRRCGRSPVEVIVVDSASHEPDATKRVARELGSRFIGADVPGAAHARNLGAVAARGEVVAFTDDDAIVDPDWIRSLALAFEDASIDAVVGPVFVQGTQPPAAMPVSAAIEPSSDRVRFSRVEPDWFDRIRFGSVGYGANLAVRRTAFRRHGLFRDCLGTGAAIPGDENYFLLCLVAQGGVVVNEPDAKVTHPPQPTHRLEAFRRSTLAYLLYVLVTQPSLRVQTIRRIVRRFLPSRRLNGPPAPRASRWPLADVVGVVVAAPRLLLAAWRIERSLARAAVMPELP